MYIPEDSILKGNISSLQPKEVFQEVCKLLGNHYEDKGFAFLKARRKMVKKIADFTLEIAFNSSHSNMAGSYICLEVIGSLYSTKLAQFDKDNGQTYKGYLLGHSDFWRQERFLTNSQRMNCNFNVYGLDENGFDEIIEYINRVFIDQTETLKDIEGILAFIENTNTAKQLGRENLRFYKFIELEYSNDSSVIDALESKNIMIQ